MPRLARYLAVPLLLVLPLLTGCNETELLALGQQVLQESSRTGGAAPLSDTDIAAGLREALRVGSERVVARLGQVDGFNRDPHIHIPLPEDLLNARRKLDRIGLAGLLDDLEVRLNRAAERAAPQARELFWQAIADMTLDDVRGILSGSDDAATRFFERRMSAGLSRAMRPLVEQCLDEVGAVRSFNKALASYRAIPFAPAVDVDLSGYVVERARRGLFLYLAQEEAAIRHDPLKRTTALLRRVFGQP